MPVLSPNGAGNWADGRDAAVPGVDISAIHWSVTGQSTWSIGLAGWPPRADALDPDQTIIAYGVVLDTDADRVPDYEFGINNDAAEAGEYRVWITDLATGVRDERVGGPYGFPVEFRHPDEQRPQDAMPGQAWEPSMVFTFLPGARPSGSPAEWQFYVWASVTEDGEVVAGDYGPDVGWLPVNSK
jgi:hypothetical protein